MRLIAGLVLLLACASPSIGATIIDQHGNVFEIIDPPDFWLSNQTDVEISPPKYFTESDIIDLCSDADGRSEPHGCASIGPLGCLISISEDLPLKSQKVIYRHEMAHCHGWPEDHPTDEPSQPLPQVIDYLLEQYSGGR